MGRCLTIWRRTDADNHSLWYKDSGLVGDDAITNGRDDLQGINYAGIGGFDVAVQYHNVRDKPLDQLAFAAFCELGVGTTCCVAMHGLTQ